MDELERGWRDRERALRQDSLWKRVFCVSFFLDIFLMPRKVSHRAFPDFVLGFLRYVFRVVTVLGFYV